MEIVLWIVGIAGIAVLVVYVVVSGLGGIVELLYNSHIPLPKSFTDYVRRKKVMEAVALLRELSFLAQTGPQRQAATYQTLPPSIGRDLYEKDILETAKSHQIRANIRVGRIRDKRFPYFIDFMEASVNPRELERLARALASFIKDTMASLEHTSPIVFSKIVTPKEGSPTLGFRTGQILNVPCVLFRGAAQPKIAEPGDPLFFFDGAVSQTDSVLLVDDSTTGGTMLLQATEKLRELGALVQHAFVLFEPEGGTAREVLRSNGVELHSAVRVDTAFLSRLTRTRLRLGPLRF